MLFDDEPPSEKISLARKREEAATSWTTGGPKLGQSAARRPFKLRDEEGNKKKLYVAAAEGEMNNFFEEGKEGRAGRTTSWRNYLNSWRTYVTNWRDGSVD